MPGPGVGTGDTEVSVTDVASCLTVGEVGLP